MLATDPLPNLIPVPMTPVNSSHIKAIGYDPLTSRLYVAFDGGTRGYYAGVPASEHRSLMSAESHGKYLDAYIKKARDENGGLRYPWQKLA